MLSASLTLANRHYELVKLVNNLLDSALPPTFLDFSDRLLAQVSDRRFREVIQSPVEHDHTAQVMGGFISANSLLVVERNLNQLNVRSTFLNLAGIHWSSWKEAVRFAELWQDASRANSENELKSCSLKVLSQLSSNTGLAIRDNITRPLSYDSLYTWQIVIRIGGSVLEIPCVFLRQSRLKESSLSPLLDVVGTRSFGLVVVLTEDDPDPVVERAQETFLQRLKETHGCELRRLTFHYLVNLISDVNASETFASLVPDWYRNKIQREQAERSTSMPYINSAFRRELADALLDAFPTEAKLRQMVYYRLGKELDQLALGSDLKEIVMKLIQVAGSEGWIPRLVVEAREANPGNEPLLLLAGRMGLALQPPLPALELERVIKKSNLFFDIHTWLQRLGTLERQVCRIEIPTNRGLVFGTGFLVSPSIVMTNYHVMEPVILGEQGQQTSKGERAGAHDVKLRFDYRQLDAGAVIDEGKIYELAVGDWLFDHSSYAAPATSPGFDALDYALIRLKGDPGSERIGDEYSSEEGKRGWISLPTKPFVFELDMPLFIIQHPQGAPLKLAFDTNSILGVNDAGTEVRYTTNTDSGSSGSPCFSSTWTLVALHHSGDPTWHPTYNAGTPISAIVKLLKERNLLDALIDR